MGLVGVHAPAIGADGGRVAGCRGRELLDDPAGQHFVCETSPRAISTTDGPIELDATLRFDGTGDGRTLTGSASGDHEVALQATGGLGDSQTLAHGMATGGGARPTHPSGSCDGHPPVQADRGHELARRASRRLPQAGVTNHDLAG